MTSRYGTAAHIIAMFALSRVLAAMVSFGRSFRSQNTCSRSSSICDRRPRRSRSVRTSPRTVGGVGSTFHRPSIQPVSPRRDALRQRFLGPAGERHGLVAGEDGAGGCHAGEEGGERPCQRQRGLLVAGADVGVDEGGGGGKLHMGQGVEEVAASLDRRTSFSIIKSYGVWRKTVLELASGASLDCPHPEETRLKRRRR